MEQAFPRGTIPQFSLATAARIAGICYLVVIVCAGFAEGVRSMLVDGNDPAASVENILASETLFRIGFAGDAVAFAADVALGLFLFLLLRPVHAGLALLAAFFRLAQASVLGINLLNQFAPLLLLNGGYADAFDAAQVAALVQFFMEAHAYGYLLGLVFFGLSSLVLGYLVFRCGYMPAIIGIALMVFVAFGYLLDSFGHFLVSGYNEMYSLVFIAPAALTEIAFALWLIVKGVKSSAIALEQETLTEEALGARRA